MQPLITVIVPCYNEEAYIGPLLESLARQDYPSDRMEVFVVDGLSSDRTREIIGRFSEKHPFIRMVDNPERYVPHALNKGLSVSSGDFVFILGAHAGFPSDYCSRLVGWHERERADLIGGICQTEVFRKNRLTNSIKSVLGSRFGVGNSEFRTGTTTVKEVDTVAFGCFRAEVFRKIGLFNERLIRNQDIELSKRILKAGGRILLVPDVRFTYFARETLAGLAKNNYGNGEWVIRTVYYSKAWNSISLRHLVPLVFLLSVTVPIPLAAIRPSFLFISAASLLAYFLTLFFISAALKNKENSFFNLLRTFITLHFSYGAGSLAGIVWVTGRLFAKK